MNAFLEISGIPLLVFVISAYYGFRVMFLKDISAVCAKDRKPPEDRDGFCREAGKLLFLFAGGALLMALLLQVSLIAGLLEILLCIAVTMLLWHRMTEKYC